jgi:hypothetical protein
LEQKNIIEMKEQSFIEETVKEINSSIYTKETAKIKYKAVLFCCKYEN